MAVIITHSKQQENNNPLIYSKELYRIDQGDSQKYSSIFIGNEHAWPDYKFEEVKNTFCHEGNNYNDYKDFGRSSAFGFKNQNSKTDENRQSIDPTGGIISIKINSIELSHLHFRPFKIMVPKEVSLINVIQQNTEKTEFSFIDYPLNIQFTGLRERYDCKIYTIDIFRKTDLEISYDLYKTLNDSLLEIELTFEIEPNETNETLFREIYLYDFQDEVSYRPIKAEGWHINTEKYIKPIASYYQFPNYKFDTTVAWFSSNGSGEQSWSQISELLWDSSSHETTLRLAISFGVSSDNGATWVWGPMTNHIDENGKFSKTKGEPLTLEEIKESLTFIDEDYWFDIIEIHEPIIESGKRFTYIPITFKIWPNEPEYNFVDREIVYRWNPKDNDKYFKTNTGVVIENNIFEGGKRQQESSFYVIRNIKGIERGISTRLREKPLKVKFEYQKHQIIFG
ncbi:MAG: hypothetical protein J1F35_03650 [Erysipelotrichales bacterium]|nr:hypothetical protein [Erysipelotrichales bacterium]